MGLEWIRFPKKMIKTSSISFPVPVFDLQVFPTLLLEWPANQMRYRSSLDPRNLRGYSAYAAWIHVQDRSFAYIRDVSMKKRLCIRVFFHLGWSKPTRSPPYITDNSILADKAANCVQRIPENLRQIFRRITIVDSADKEFLESKGRMHIPAGCPAHSPRQPIRGWEDSITSEKPFTEMNGKEVKDLADLPTQ